MLTDAAAISRELNITAQTLSYLQTDPASAGHFHDLREELGRLRTEGSWLPAQQLLRLSTTLKSAAQLRRQLTVCSDEGSPQFPLLHAEFLGMPVCLQVAEIIDRVIDKFGEVSSSASPLLAQIRREIASAQASMGAVMRRVIERAVQQGIVEADASPTMRDGRLVLPVPSTRRKELPGILHDQSATGKTSFLEPLEVVAASSRLRELQEQEKREVHRILLETASNIRPYRADIKEIYSFVGRYDILQAKASLASELGGELPVLEEKPEIEWYGARHPILARHLEQEGRAIVPLDLQLTGGKRILIISGPNAGGKSVVLKTVAIVQYMAQCGLLPTMYSNSHLGVFQKIMLDIGDSQSLENDLSTYSSHLRSMKTLVKQADSHSLILADEMGSGTEPVIGGALAQAIISTLAKKKTWGLITTHYNNLKAMASEVPEIENGAMMYDRHHMQPLFKLEQGSPGSSFALDIAHRIGLPKDIIEEARTLAGEEHVKAESYLLDITRDRRYLHRKRQQIQEKERLLQERIDKYDERLSGASARSRQILEEARVQAKEILDGTNARIERTILEIRRTQAEKENTRKLRAELQEYKKQVEKASSDSPQRKKGKEDAQKTNNSHSWQKPPQTALETIQPGSYVRMSQGGAVGKVLAINKKKAEVAFGAVRTRVELANLIPAKEPKKPAQTTVQTQGAAVSAESRQRQLSFSPDIDVRGMRADEALQALMYYLDDARQFSIPRVRILHGTGTGALRQAIRSWLQGQASVVRFKDEDVRLGGAGITVVDME